MRFMERFIFTLMAMMASIFCVAATSLLTDVPSATNCYETYQPSLGWFDSLPQICVQGTCSGSCVMRKEYVILGFGEDTEWETVLAEQWRIWCECDGVRFCSATSTWTRSVNWPPGSGYGQWMYSPGPCSGDCGGGNCFAMAGTGPGGVYQVGDRLCGCP